MDVDSREQETDITAELFAADFETQSSGLKSAANYTQFGKQVANVLYEGKSPYNIPAFFTELFRNLPKTDCTAMQLK